MKQKHCCNKNRWHILAILIAVLMVTSYGSELVDHKTVEHLVKMSTLSQPTTSEVIQNVGTKGELYTSSTTSDIQTDLIESNIFKVSVTHYYDFKCETSKNGNFVLNTLTLSKDSNYAQNNSDDIKHFYNSERLVLTEGNVYSVTTEQGGIPNCSIRRVRYFKRTDLPDHMENPYVSLNLQNECENGLIKVVNDEEVICEPVCGDSVLTQNEACDDGNTEGGDGCSADCKNIEDGWICEYSKDSNFSICQKNKQDIETESSPNHRELGAFTNDNISYTFVWSAVGLGVISHLIYACLSKTSYQSMWSLFNLFQLILLIPACGLHLPSMLDSLIGSMTPALLSFKHYNCDDSSMIRDLFGTCKIDQKQPEFMYIGLESGSTFMNTLIVTLFLGFLVFVHLVVWPFACCCMTPNEETGSCKRAVRRFFSYFNFGLYIRFILETCLVYSLASISEIYRTDTKAGRQLRSLVIACCALAMVVTALVVFHIHWCKNKENSDSEDNTGTMREAYTGYKNTKFARMFTQLFILRRILFALVIGIFYNQLHRDAKIGIIVGIQAIYWLLLILSRPYETTKDNVLEIVNESVYLLVTALFIYYKNDDRMKDYAEIIIYVLLMIAINFYYILGFYMFIYHLCTADRPVKVENDKKQSSSHSEHSEVKTLPKQAQRSRANVVAFPVPVPVPNLTHDDNDMDRRYQDQETGRNNQDQTAGKFVDYKDFAKHQMFGDNQHFDSRNSKPYYKHYRKAS